MLRNPYCVLVGTSEECDYIGSVKTLKVARVEEIETLPDRSDDGAPVSQAPVGFFPTTFVEYNFLPDTVIFTETGKQSKGGQVYNQKVEGFHAGVASEALYEVARLADGHYILIIELFAGPIRMLGTKDVPFLFNSNFTSGKKSTETAGTLFLFNGQSDFPALTLTTTTTNTSSPCALLTASDWIYQPWDINVGANYRLDKIYVNPNPNGLIIAVTSHPNGTLYDNNNSVIDTLVWNASGWYEPQNGPHTIIGTWRAEIPNLLVNTGSPVTSCSLSFSQEFSLTNSPPEFTFIGFIGVASVGNTLTLLSAYNDVDGDAPGSHDFSFWLADDANGTNETSVSSTSSYTIDPADGGKFIQARGTPKAATGASPGAEVVSAWIEIPESTPTASNVQISGIPESGETLTGTYDYSDPDGDLEDTGATVKEWFSYTDAAGTIGETSLGTGDTYDPVALDHDLYIKFKVTPHAQTGQSPGMTAESAVFGPIIHYEEFTFQTDRDPGTDGAFTPSLTYTGQGIVRWIFADLSELTGQSISTSGNGLNGTTQTVTIKVQSLVDIEAIYLNSQNIKGAFDTTGLEGLYHIDARDNDLTDYDFDASQSYDVWHLSQNPNLVIPGADFAIPYFNDCSIQAVNCDITGAMVFQAGSVIGKALLGGNLNLTSADFSNTILDGGNSSQVNLDGCSNLSTLLFPSSAGGVMGEIRLTDTNVSSLDVSGILIRKKLQFTRTPMTTVNYGNQTYLLTQIVAQDCLLYTEAPDLSGFTYLPNFLKYSDSPIEGLILPIATNAMSTGIALDGCDIAFITNLASCTSIANVDGFYFDIRDNGLTATEINTIAVDFDTVAVGGYSAREYRAETNNAVHTAGPPDGAAAFISIGDKDFTATAET